MTPLAPDIAASIELHEVAADRVPELWDDRVAPLLAPALRYHPFVELRDVNFLLVTSFAQLIVAMTPGGEIVAAVVIERVRYPSRMVANILAMGAKPGCGLTLLRSLEEYCEAWSRARGCDTIALVGRLGWTRVLGRRAGDKSLRLAQLWRRLHQHH